MTTRRGDVPPLGNKKTRLMRRLLFGVVLRSVRVLDLGRYAQRFKRATRRRMAALQNPKGVPTL
jgi:hypothetical protein